MSDLSLLNGDAFSIPLASESIHCVITSPPYWGLRDYGLGGKGIGLEATPDEYIANMVAVGREIWRVLRDDGTFWLNLGDTYSGYHGNSKKSDGAAPSNKPGYWENMRGTTVGVGGLKQKDLVGIPWRVALALQADGWYLRSDIIWSKPNPMPESVTDRPTKSHEYVFLLTKRARYFYDNEAIKEPLPEAADGTRVFGGKNKHGANYKHGRTTGRIYDSTPSGRNRRTVWTIATQCYSGKHFAAFPEALVEPMIKAGTSEYGCCPECGKPWKRVTKNTPMVIRRSDRTHAFGRTRSSGTMIEPPRSTTTGFTLTCDHDHSPIPATILDPFCGSGTAGIVARRLGRNFIGIDLSPEYLQLARERTEVSALSAWNEGTGQEAKEDNWADMPLFANHD